MTLVPFPGSCRCHVPWPSLSTLGDVGAAGVGGAGPPGISRTQPAGGRGKAVESSAAATSSELHAGAVGRGQAGILAPQSIDVYVALSDRFHSAPARDRRDCIPWRGIILS